MFFEQVDAELEWLHREVPRLLRCFDTSNLCFTVTNIEPCPKCREFEKLQEKCISLHFWQGSILVSVTVCFTVFFWLVSLFSFAVLFWMTYVCLFFLSFVILLLLLLLASLLCFTVFCSFFLSSLVDVCRCLFACLLEGVYLYVSLCHVLLQQKRSYTILP